MDDGAWLPAPATWWRARLKRSVVKVAALRISPTDRRQGSAFGAYPFRRRYSDSARTRQMERGSSRARARMAPGDRVMTPDQQWHWGEGNKFAMEAMKALLLLNGGGALALLTFFGTRGKMTAVTADAIGNALLSFGVGTVGRRLHFRAGLLDATALRQL